MSLSGILPVLQRRREFSVVAEALEAGRRPWVTGPVGAGKAYLLAGLIARAGGRAAAWLVVSPDRVESVEPVDALVSFLLPDGHFRTSAANVMAQFCHFVFFFPSRSSGERWVGKHPGTFLYSLDEAFALAKRLNAKNFGTELARRASATAAIPRSA